MPAENDVLALEIVRKLAGQVAESAMEFFFLYVENTEKAFQYLVGSSR
jgi:hypothetical protein